MDGFNDTTVVNNVTKEDEKVRYTGESSVTVTAHKNFLVDEVQVFEGMKYVRGSPLLDTVSTEMDATEMEARTHSNDAHVDAPVNKMRKVGSSNDAHVDASMNKKQKVHYTGESSVTVTAHKDFLVDEVRVFEGMECVRGSLLLAFLSTETDATEMEACMNSHITYSVPLSELGVNIKNVTKEDDKDVRQKSTSLHSNLNVAQNFILNICCVAQPLSSSKAFTVYTVTFDCIVTKLLVKTGTQVRKGQALFVLEPVEIKVGSLDDDHDDALVNKKRKVSYTGESSVTVTAHKDFLVDRVRVFEGMKYVRGSPLQACVSTETDATELEALTHSHVTYSVPLSELGIYDKNVTKKDDKVYLNLNLKYLNIVRFK